MLGNQELPVEQWVYGVFQHTVAGGGTPIMQADPNSSGWRITKIQVFAQSNPCVLSVGDNPSFTIAANGCCCLEPAGYLPPHATVAAAGDDTYILIEYLWKVTLTGVSPNILVT